MMEKPTPRQQTAKKIASVVGWLTWVTAAFLVGGIVVLLPIEILHRLGVIDLSRASVFATMVINAAVYAAGLAVAVIGPWLLRRKRNSWPGIRELLGLSRRIEWRDVGYGLVAVSVYYVILRVVMLAAVLLLGQSIMDQPQALGYDKIGNSFWQSTVIFVALVIVTPVAEELMMRGLLFGRLRKLLSFWPTAILISLLFAALHGQINVGIDTFVLSMVLCYIREQTGAVWGPMILHAVKNGVAFVAIFVIHVT